MKINPKENPLDLFKFIPIPAGKFIMGSPKDEKHRYDDEDQVKVEITKPFEMQETQVTQLQWSSIMDDNPSTYEGVQKPVHNVSWLDAADFCNRLGILDQKYVYRLPTEAEWEYACRAGSTAPYHCGHVDNLKDYAFFDSNNGPQAVKSLLANDFGLYDMHGNVWEWCSNWYDKKLMNGLDPKGPKTGSVRVLRGGSWFAVAQNLRSAYRYYYDPGLRDDNLGFRLVREDIILSTLTLSRSKSETRESAVEAILEKLDSLRKDIEELK